MTKIEFDTCVCRFGRHSKDEPSILAPLEQCCRYYITSSVYLTNNQYSVWPLFSVSQGPSFDLASFTSALSPPVSFEWRHACFFVSRPPRIYGPSPHRAASFCSRPSPSDSPSNHPWLFPAASMAQWCRIWWHHRLHWLILWATQMVSIFI